MRLHSCHVSICTSVAYVSRLSCTGVSPWLRSLEMRRWALVFGNPPFWLSPPQFCDLIFHVCLINPCHGQVARRSCCHHLVGSSSHRTPTQGLGTKRTGEEGGERRLCTGPQIMDEGRTVADCENSPWLGFLQPYKWRLCALWWMTCIKIEDHRVVWPW